MHFIFDMHAIITKQLKYSCYFYAYLKSNILIFFKKMKVE